MWDLIASVPAHCLSFYFIFFTNTNFVEISYQHDDRRMSMFGNFKPDNAST